MDTFEYITALVAVVIGLAIADLATSLHRLLRNRKKVEWDWVAPLAALVLLVELFNLWWRWRGFSGSTVGEVFPYFAALILAFLTASITLPDDVPEEGLDLGAYFDGIRGYFWFVYPTYVGLIVALLSIRRWQEGASLADLLATYYFDLVWLAVAYGLIFVRKRWISGLLLVATLVWLIWGLQLWSRAPDLPT